MALLRRTKLGIGLLLAFTCFSAPLKAQKIAVAHCQGSCPTYSADFTASRSTVVVHHLYAAGLNADSGRADWVAYHLSKEAVGVASLLPRTWQPDRLIGFSGSEDFIELESTILSLSEISAASNPYGGFTEPARVQQDRARLAPMTSFANTPYWSELNNLSNMVPMPTPLRVGAWLRLEQALNQLVAGGEELFVVTGPLFVIGSALNTSNGFTEVEPAAYYKIVTGKNGFVTFVFPKELDQQANYCAQIGNLEQVETMSGLQLLPDSKAAASQIPGELVANLGCARF